MSAHQKIGNHSYFARPFYLYILERSFIMSELYDPVDSLIKELKGNAIFLNRLLFPRIALLVGAVGMVGVIIALALVVR